MLGSVLGSCQLLTAIRLICHSETEEDKREIRIAQ
jgi:hypothetical protein